MSSFNVSSTRGISRRALLQRAAGAAALTALGSIRRATAQDGDLTPVTLALDWYANANHAGIYVAQANGYFEEAGLDVEIFVPADPTTVLQTVGAGRDTFGISYQTDILQARTHDVPVVSVAALVQHPLNSVMVLERSDIMSIADLKGKSIAMAGLPSDEAFVKTMLEHHGLTIDDVEMINVGYDLMPAVFSGRADAATGVYWTHETILAEHEGNPVRYFRIEENGVPDHYELLLVAGEETIDTQSEVVTGMLGALRKGYDDAAADLDGALALLMAESPDLVEDVEREGLDLLAPMWTDNGSVQWGDQSSELWESFTQWTIDTGLIEDSVDAASAFRNDLFPESNATPEASPTT